MRKHIALGVDNDVSRMWNGHFGMAPKFQIYDADGNFLETRPNPYGFKPSLKHIHHDDPQRIAELLSDCKTFIARRMGEESRRRLVQLLDVETVLTEARDPESALLAYLKREQG